MRSFSILVLQAALTLLLTASPISAQDEPEAGDGEALSRGFSTIELGLTLEMARQRLEGDPNFAYRGEPDVSLLASPNRTLLEVPGANFVDRALLQFRDESLFSLSLEINTSRLDYFTMYRTLSDSFGEPSSLSPARAVWEDEQTRISLERPLTVRYLDRDVFESIREAGQAQESLEELSRDRFLEQF